MEQIKGLTRYDRPVVIGLSFLKQLCFHFCSLVVFDINGDVVFRSSPYKLLVIEANSAKIYLFKL